MAHWRKKEEDFEQISTILAEHPGLSASELARRLDVEPSTLTRLLPSVEEAGVLLCEDDRGRLSLFKRGK